MRNGSTSRTARLLGCLFSVGLAACGADDRIELRTGDSVSDARGGDSALRSYDFELRGRGGGTIETRLNLELVGIVDSPRIDETTLQATDAQWHGHNVVVSYNVRGDQFLGALQVIDARHPERPRVVAEAIYRNTDLSNLRVSGSTIVAAGADAELGGTLEMFNLVRNELSIEGLVELGSYAGTYVELQGQRAMVTYGDLGGGVAIFTLGRDGPTLDQRLELTDARWVSPLPGDGLVTVAGSPGRILRYDRVSDVDRRSLDSVEVDGACIGAPTWAQRREDLLYLSSDDAGLLVYDLDDLDLVGRLVTEGTANGSALSLDGRLTFLANGEEGLVVADVVDPTDPLVLATIDIADDAGSANAVSLHRGYAALADGLAGVKLLSYRRTVPGHERDCDGDGLFDDEDPDADDDGVLDDEDDDRCNPDVVCAAEELHRTSRFVGDFFNLPCDHPDVEGPTTGVVEGTLPWDFDWYDEQYYAFTIERPDLQIEYTEDYFPVDTGLCGDPYYFAAHWTTTAIASEEGVYVLELASDDDSWLFVDDRLLIDRNGVHAMAPRTAECFLTAGPHRLDVYFAERNGFQSGLVLDVVDVPSPTARLELIQHLCLDPAGDEDVDGIPNDEDVAPLTRPDAD